MVRYNYSDFEEQYKEVIKVAAGRKACTILILVAFDVDAMAAARMLTQQLRRDDITYERVSVINFDEVKAVVKTSLSNENNDIKTVFLLNCGAIYDIPKHFNLEYGSDLRCFILDHHRPIHLKNIYSRHNVVVFDDNYDESYEGGDDVPSEASVMSSEIADESDDDSLRTEEEVEDEEAEFDEEEEIMKKESRKAVEDGAEEAEEVQNNQDDADLDFDPEDNPDEVKDGDDEASSSEADDASDKEEEKEEDEGESLEDGDGEAVDLDEKDDIAAHEDGDEVEEATIEDDESNDQPKKQRVRRIRNLEDDDEDESGFDQAASSQLDLDKTFVAGYDHEDEEAEAAELERTMNLDDEEEGENEEYDDHDEAMANQEDEEDSFQMVGKRKRRVDVDDRKKKRQKIQQYYRRAITHVSPISVMLLQFIRGKYDNIPLDVIWQSILGVTDQFQRGHISEHVYDEYCQYIKAQLGDHLSTAAERASYHVQDTPSINLGTAATAAADGTTAIANTVTIAGGQKGHIEEVADYRFYLSRHWSVFDAMQHSSYIASRFTIWNAEGKEKFQELFAKMGVPLPQAKQKYNFMKPECRQHFRNQILTTNIQTKYKLINPIITFKSFCRFTNYKNPIAANDIVQAANSLLEIYSYDQTILSLSYDKENHRPTTADLADITMNNYDENTNSQQTDNQSQKNKVDSIYYDTIQASNKDLFNQVYKLLGTKDEASIKDGVNVAIETQQTIAKKAFAMIDANSIQRYNRIYYAYLFSSTSTKKSSTVAKTSSSAAFNQHHLHRNHSNDSTSAISFNNENHVIEKELIFGRPNVLARLGQFIMEVKRNLPKKQGGWTGQYLLPLILLSERQDSSFLVMGISPFSCISNQLDDITEEQKQKLAPLINFKQFFKLAAKDMGIKIRHNSFDPNVIEVQKEDVQDFLGALNNALKKATPTYFNNQSSTNLMNQQWK